MRSSSLLVGLLVIAGCATPPIPSQQPVPEQFLEPCRAVEREIMTNGDLAKALLDHKEALARCNIDKEAIREWSREVSGSK